MDQILIIKKKINGVCDSLIAIPSTGKNILGPVWVIINVEAAVL